MIWTVAQWAYSHFSQRSDPHKGKTCATKVTHAALLRGRKSNKKEKG